MIHKRLLTLLAVTIFLSTTTFPQGTLEDYKRADEIRNTYRNKTFHDQVSTQWIDSTHFLWYSVNTPKGTEYFLVDADKGLKKPAFDAEKLAKALAKVLDREIKAYELPLRRLIFEKDLKSLSFMVDQKLYTCDLKKYTIQEKESPARPDWDRSHWGSSRNELGNDPVVSPDSAWEAYIKDYDVYVKRLKDRREFRLSWDGTEGEFYSSYLYWSPDSKKILANKFTPGYTRMVHYIESSPEGQLQPKHSEIEYAKPGDKLPHLKPALFLVEEQKHLPVSDELYPDQFDLSRFEWRKDSRAITFEYNQRGHQAYRIVEIEAAKGTPSVLVDEQCETFFHYSGKRYRYDLNDGEEIIWASERDGWNHLYLYDGATGKVKNQITKGDWLVRGVTFVNEKDRTILFEASGREAGDPYLIHLYRINFDGTGLTHLTPAEGNHQVSFSWDQQFLTDTWSMVDQPPQTVLRNAQDGSVILPLEKSDISPLLETNWKVPEVFTAKGRDGKTDIWGIIVRPSNFDPTKKYPVIEYIYAGPHSSFVPKSFSITSHLQSMAELGFILVQCDGMGTSNRSKAFHDVCWQNLGDGGFPDRIAWMKAAAEKYPYMDLEKVGIYGTSAGGQSSTGAVLFHPEFYKVAVSSCGCHDNRMDKIWWNEQWMGYPLGPHYAEASNVDNAYRLEGKLFLMVGEMDDNVDPASTMQVVDALIKANKNFDLLVIPGARHTSGGQFGEHKRRDFFVKHLLGVDPPEWNLFEKGEPKDLTGRPLPDFKAGLDLIIYKTKADYSDKVPVILSKDKKTLVSYPHPSDLKINGKLATPTQLDLGYWLDNRGINAQVAFTSYTYEHYADLPKSPNPSELLKSVIDADPITEMYNCGPRSDFKTVDDINLFIRSKLDSAKKIK